jgi:hypothetical protein
MFSHFFFIPIVTAVLALRGISSWQQICEKDTLNRAAQERLQGEIECP